MIRRGIYESLSAVANAFASPARLKVIQILAQSPRSVEELAQETGESVANVSQHLQKLSKARVTSCERSGVKRIYRVINPKVLQIWENFQDLSHELDPALDLQEGLLTNPSLHALEPAAEIMREVRAGKAVLIDAREEKESAATPVSGALPISLTQLRKAKNLKELGLTRSKPIFVLCRGRYCSIASNAVLALRTWGCDVYRLRESPFQLNRIASGVRARTS